MTRRPLMLDLFCGAGGCSVGYHRAGFDVVGVDIAPQPRYPFDFHQADALTYPLDGFDAVHASPPCQRWSSVTRTNAAAIEHPDRLTPTLSRLRDQPAPWIVENVPGAPLPDDAVTLCGSMFELDVRRHRLFATSWGLPDHHWPCRHGIWGRRYAPNRSDRRRDPHALARVVVVAGGGGGGLGQRTADWRRAMGIQWMTRKELAQAIPPAYTEWIGARLLDHLAVAA